MKTYYARVNMAGEIEQINPATGDWPHTQPGHWVRLEDKRKPDGTYNFMTGEFE